MAKRDSRRLRSLATPAQIDGLFDHPSYRHLEGNRYSRVILRPWPNLVFLVIPLLIFEYEVCVARNGPLADKAHLTAPSLIEWLVMVLGVGPWGFIFPGLILIAILFASHLAAHHPWRFSIYYLFGMLGESIVWSVPILAYGHLLSGPIQPTTQPASNVWFDEIIRSLGAGLYEELVFRLICITALHMLLANFLRFPASASSVVAVMVSAAFFAGIHVIPQGSEHFHMATYLFRAGIGIYLGFLFLFRGFGITVGAHIVHNIITVTIKALGSPS